MRLLGQLLVWPLLFIACSGEADDPIKRIDKAVKYLDGREVVLTGIAPGRAWEFAKASISRETDLVDAIYSMTIDEQGSIELQTRTEDCAYFEDGVISYQRSSPILANLKFSQIDRIEESEEEFSDYTAYYLRLYFSQSFLILQSWNSCDGSESDLVQQADKIASSVLFSFPNKKLRSEYRKKVEVLIESNY